MIDFKINLKSNFFNKRHLEKIEKFGRDLIIKTEKISFLHEQNFSVIVVGEDEMIRLSKKHTDRRPVGMFSAKKMTIYILDSLDREEFYDTYFHEIGHLIDYILGINNGFNDYYSSNMDISNVMKKDMKHMNYVFAVSEQEFFAQAFSECFRNTYNSFFMHDTRDMFKKLSVL